MTYNYTLHYPHTKKSLPVSDVLKELMIPRKWRHYLRIEKNVLINQHYRNFNELVTPDDCISLHFTHVASLQQSYPKSGQLPKIVYEDDDLLVINKKRGQKTHPNLFETNTALNDCATYLKQSPYIVHRLDMLTGGLLLVAKNPAVVPILNHELTNKLFHREYLAKVTHADKLANTGTINLPISQDPNDQRKRMIHNDGLPAVTHYEVLNRYHDNSALIKLTLQTGRTHQIRVHLAAIGSPIIGDPLYNPNFHKNEQLELTAYQMSLIKPFTFNRITINLK